MITVEMNTGVYSGKNLDTIIRREFGRKAIPRPSVDPNNPHWGLVVEYVPAVSAYKVLARINRVDGSRMFLASHMAHRSPEYPIW